MSELIRNVLKILIAMLPLITMLLLSRKLNIPRADRSKQYLMPVITVVYVIIAMLLIGKFNEWMGLLIKYIPIWITNLGRLGFIPEAMGNALLDFGNFLHSQIRRIDLHFWLFFISNTLIVAIYFVIKKVCIEILSRKVKNDGVWHTRISGVFYEFFSEKSKWCLRDSFAHTRSTFKTFYYTVLILSCLLMIVSRFLYYKGMIATVFYPVFGILVIGELYFYLDGVTRQEYTEDILGEDENAYRTVNYSLLRKFLRSVFGDKLLTENTSINNALSYGVTTDDVIRDMEKSEDPKIVSYATYLNALNKTGFDIDHNYLNSSLDLLNGKSILFNNPFYNDLIPYAFYPMNRVLLSHRKVLIVLGRHSIEDDIVKWVEKGIEAVTNIPFMWNVGVLNNTAQDFDIGIITRSDVLDIQLHNANSEFLENVGYFVVIEPSKLITTAQIGLNMIAKKCKSDEDNNVVFCLCDKNCDGLVDAMSHTLMTSFTEVSATNKHRGTSSYMCWSADDEYLHHRLVPNISRYLGMGTELSFAALKNQVSKTKWYGGETFPVADMRWIDRQYYYTLTKYASLPTNQEAMDNHFETSSNFWSAEVEKNNYFTVEDESNNMFEILREFSTRSTEQGFINVISSDYLLRDYMAENASIFEEDAKAMPCIVADYTRSNRNTLLRLVLMMSTYPVTESFLKKELSLLGIDVFHLRKQLWYELYCCYSSTTVLCALPKDYIEAVEYAFGKKLFVDDIQWSHRLFKSKEVVDFKNGKVENAYYIVDKNFIKHCVAQLRSAGYVAEDEKGERYYLGAELCDHIYQKYLPGQFFTFAGKYYEMQYVTADDQVLVRRAADHINGRPEYRQIRNYTIYAARQSDRIGACKNIEGMRVIKEFADFTVDTPGYYRMERYNDFAHAKAVYFEGDKNGIPQRVYHNKEILRIQLPEFDGKLNDNVRFTVTVILNELFRTLFAENHPYICALTDDSFIGETDETPCTTYSVRTEVESEGAKNSIYILEDSQLDLGLTVAVERNLTRIINMVYDYLEWHTEALSKSLNPREDTPTGPCVTLTEISENPEEKKEKFFGRVGNWFKRIGAWFKKLFKRKKKSEEEEPSVEEIPVADDSYEPENEGKVPSQQDADIEEIADTEDLAEPLEEIDDSDAEVTSEFVENSEETSQIPDVVDDGSSAKEDIADSEDSSKPEDLLDEQGTLSITDTPLNAPACDEVTPFIEEDDNEIKGFTTEKQPYHKRYYLLFGGLGENSALDVAGAVEYLSQMGLKRNPLKQARQGRRIADHVAATFKPGKPDARYCDFCGTEIFGVEYETLADGRDRCMHCSRTAIKTSEEFRSVFADVKRNMESFFGIKINTGIRVEMVNSKKLHRRLGHAFVPTAKTDARVLGVAIHDKNGYTLLVENGSPRMASMLTMAHELTHIWQYINWKDKAIRRKYGRNMRLEIYEGMAKWVEIQYAYLINEPALAKREEIITANRDDEYGRGFLRYRENYPFSLGTVITHPTPFMNLTTPLDPAYCGTITVRMPTAGVNPGDVQTDVPVDDESESSSVPDRVLPTNPVKGSVERNPDDVNRYAYSYLYDYEKNAYNIVLEAINNFVSEVDIIDLHITDAQLQLIIDYLHRDHPEIFWFQKGATFYFDSATHIVSKVEFRYCLTPQELAERQQEIDEQIDAFMGNVNETMSDYEVVKQIYENIIGMVDYDTLGLENQGVANIQSEEPDDLRSIYGVFVNKKAVCAGYAKAFQYLLNKCGIECTFVNSQTHAWNLINLEGDYYHIDVTWGDGSDTKAEKIQLDSINYDCFCITTEEVLRLEEHNPAEDLPLPECTATKCNYHIRHGLYLEQYDFERVRAIACECVDNDDYDISVKFADMQAYTQAKQHLVDNGKFKEIVQYINLKSGKRIGSKFMYSLRPEKLIIAFFTEKL